MTDTITHDYLVQRAAKWLRNSMKCGVVIAERIGMMSEIPDAIGWRAGGMSILVECKTSRSDFRRDLKKPWRCWREGGLGTYRYYLAPPGIIPSGELPEGWGLLECRPRIIKKIVNGQVFQSDISVRRERVLLLAMIRKMQRDA